MDVLGTDERLAAVCRKQESEADEIGVMLAARACFEPKAAAIVFTKLGEKEKQMARVPQWLLTHPLSQARSLDGHPLFSSCMGALHSKT